MLWIACPQCGQRPETEFVFGGEAVSRPAAPESVSDSFWARYLYVRENRLGVVRERWWHRAGCNAWFWTDRDTATDHMPVATDPKGDAR